MNTKVHDSGTGRPSAVVAYAVWALAFLWLLAFDHYVAFLQPKLRPLLVVGMILSVIFGLSIILRRGKQHAGGGGLVKCLVMLVPIVFVFVAYGNTLGTQALATRLTGGHGGQWIVEPMEFVPDSMPDTVSGPDHLSIYRIRTNGPEYYGKDVQTTGMAFSGESVPEGYIFVFRFLVACCAADAMPIPVLVKTDNTMIPDEAWISVTGTLVPTKVNGVETPIIDAKDIRPINTPSIKDQYLYPW